MRSRSVSNALRAAILAALLAAGCQNGTVRESTSVRGSGPDPQLAAAAIEDYLLTTHPPSSYCVRLALIDAKTMAVRTKFEDSTADVSPAGYRRVLDAPNSAASRQLRAQLEILAAQGYLERHFLKGGAIEFTMTWKGFAASDSSGCFHTVTGRPAVAVESGSGKAEGALMLYEVVARVSPGTVPAWAKTEAFEDAFGEQAARLMRPRSAKFELARSGRGYTVVSQNGRLVNPGSRFDRTVMAVYAQRAGPVDAERVKRKLQAELEGRQANGRYLCLPLPQRLEYDETDVSVFGWPPGGREQGGTDAHFTYYNLVNSSPFRRRSVLRGYAAMRKLESLGLATSEELPEAEFRGAQAAGAVRFTIRAETFRRFADPTSRCFMVGKLVVDRVIAFEPIELWRYSSRVAARLKVAPVEPLGEKALRLYGNFRRMAEVGIGMRGILVLSRDGIVVRAANIPQLAFDPDVSGLSLPVVPGGNEKPCAPKTRGMKCL